jgi:tetratricopeptide (TPR) repeat protein
MFLKRVLILLLISAAAFAQTPKARQNYDKALRDIEHHNLQHAEKLLRKAIADSPNWALAYSQLGGVYLLMNKSAAALDAYEHARDLDLKDRQLTLGGRRGVLFGIGLIYGMQHEYDKSIAVLESAIKDDPDYGPYEYNLACAYSEKGDLDQALIHLQRSWDLRDTFKFPDVTKDSSFKRWLNNPRFQEVAGKMVV